MESASEVLPDPTETLIIELVTKVLGFQSPVAAHHVFDAAAASPTPVKIFPTGMEPFPAARARVAIVDNTGFIIHTDSAAGSIEQPFAKGDTKAPTRSHVEIAF